MSGLPTAPRGKAGTPVLTPRSRPASGVPTPPLGGTPRGSHRGSGVNQVDLPAAARAAAHGRSMGHTGIVPAPVASYGMPKAGATVPMPTPHPLSTKEAAEAERNKNRKMLHDVGASHEHLLAEFNAFKEAIMKQQTEHELTMTTQMSLMETEFHAAREQRAANHEALAQQSAQANILHQKLAGDLEAARRERMEMKTEVAAAHAATQQDVQALRREKEAIGIELQVVREAHHAKAAEHHARWQEHHEEIASLKQGTSTREEEIRRHQQQVKEHSEQITRLQAGPQALSEELKEHQRKVQEHHQMIATIRDSTKQREQELEEHGRKMKEHQKEMDRLKESAEGTTGKLNKRYEEHQQEISRLKEGVKTGDAFNSLKSLAELTSLEFKDVKQQLFDKGVLSHAIEKPPEDEDQPVGAIDLGEDIFTTRLLLKLGLRKGRYDELKAAREEAGEGLEPTGGAWREESKTMQYSVSGRSLTAVSVAEDDCSLSSGSSFPRERSTYTSLSELSVSEEMLAAFDHVSGLGVPEVEDGGWAHTSITSGWLSICCVTLTMQLVILGVLLHTYVSTAPCVKEQLVGQAWWLLHISRCAAMIVAGGLMTKELMDVINYFMVSELLEPLSCEVLVTTFCRVAMIGVVAAANVFLFMSSTSPADVWMNMTALGFVGTLGQDMLDIAKRGVFGHHIAKAIGGVNFQISFLSEYPSWFSKIKSVTLGLAICGVVGFSVFMFLDEDVICPLTPEEMAGRRHHHEGIGSSGVGASGSGGGAGMGGGHHR